MIRLQLIYKMDFATMLAMYVGSVVPALQPRSQAPTARMQDGSLGTGLPAQGVQIGGPYAHLQNGYKMIACACQQRSCLYAVQTITQAGPLLPQITRADPLNCYLKLLHLVPQILPLLYQPENILVVCVKASHTIQLTLMCTEHVLRKLICNI